MPACRALQLRPSLVISAQIHDTTCAATASRVLTARPGRQNSRNASRGAALAVKPASADLESTSHSPVRTALHKTTLLLPRVLTNGNYTLGPAKLAFWQEVLDEAYDRLNNAGTDASARVVGEFHAILFLPDSDFDISIVYGCDEHSGARELVTALLEEPFAPDIRKAAIRNRWEAGSEDPERVITCVSLQLVSVLP